jgi:pimeloyl-ACP methyl ester carboxylesterase
LLAIDVPKATIDPSRLSEQSLERVILLSRAQPGVMAYDLHRFTQPRTSLDRAITHPIARVHDDVRSNREHQSPIAPGPKQSVTPCQHPCAACRRPSKDKPMAYPTYYRTATVKGRNVFYREAGDPTAPTIVLLHGLPTSSQMFRDLIPRLADRFHLIAPDYIGFGHSDAPSRTEFSYTFDNLADHVAGLLDVLHLSSYILYMQDYGGPVGFRLFSRAPSRVKGFIIQNTNAYMEGVGDAPKQALLPLWENRNPTTEQAARDFVSLAGTKFHWLVGAKESDAINPDNWVLDQALLDRPGVQDCQVDLLENYKSNIALYPQWQADFRTHQPKTLIVWGKHDPFFIPPGAEAYLADLPKAKLVWLDSGHFVLDENVEQVAAEIRDVFA